MCSICSFCDALKLILKNYTEIDMMNALEVLLPVVHGQALGANAGNVGSETLSYDEGHPVAELTMDLSHNRLSSIDFDMGKAKKNFFSGSSSFLDGGTATAIGPEGLSPMTMIAFRSITALNISANSLASLKGFVSMPFLKELAASRNRITDTCGLEQNKFLMQLDLSHNPIW